MRATHTPGPWTRENHYIHAATERFLAVTKDASEGVGRANADLIAAAPELLAALEDIVRLTETRDFWLPKRWLEDARAAIAKAEGNP